jgi:hypothetical protein
MDDEIEVVEECPSPDEGHVFPPDAKDGDPCYCGEETW